MKKKGFLIVIPVITLIAVMFFFGVKKYNSSFSNFKYDGYVLDNTSDASSSSYYFTKDTKYKVKTSKGVVNFDNTDKVEVSVPDDSFLHYGDGSVSVFKKSVVLNLDDLSKSSLQFYNVYGGSIFTKKSNGYDISYLNNKLTFKNFLVKVSENKYMIVGNNITIKHGEKTEKVTDGYVEFVYLDGNIVRITNQSLEIQNISSDLSIFVDGVKVDLENKKIYLDDTFKLNLGEITIDSDDNIEIVQDEENTNIDNPDLDGQHGIGDGSGSGSGSGSDDEDDSDGGSTSYTPNVNISGLKDGVIDTSTEKKEEVVIENVTVPDPVFNLEVFTVSQTGFSYGVSIDVETSQNVSIPPDGEIQVKVIELSTNSVVYYKTYTADKRDFSDQSNNALKPDTNYAFIVHCPYEKNEIMYEKDFIQKTFVSEPVGIEVEKAYAKSNGFGITVKKTIGSPVTAFTYIILDEDGNEIPGLTETLEDITLEDRVTYTFEDSSKYKSNTRYKYKITSVINGNLAQENFDPIVIDILTLKERPIFASDSIVQTNDMQNKKFNFYLRNINDLDHGIEEYRVDLYEVRTKKLVASRSSNTSGTIEMLLDGTIQRNVTYSAKVVVLFNDNEKLNEFEIGETAAFTMGGIDGPSVTFTVDDSATTFEHFVGNISIYDPNDTIDHSSNIVITYAPAIEGAISNQETVPVSQLTKIGDTYNINANYNYLAANTSYVFHVYARVNYNDGEAGYVNANISTFYYTTKPTLPMTANWQDNESSSHNFSVNLNLSRFDEDAGKDREYIEESKTLTRITVRLYANTFDTSSDPCNAEHKCWEIVLKDGLERQPYESTLKNEMYGLDEENELRYKTITEQDFLTTNGGPMASLTEMGYGDHYIEVVKVVDYTTYANEIPVENAVHPVFNKGGNVNPLKGIIVTPILNQGSQANLGYNTIIGYKACPEMEGSGYTITNYSYSIVGGGNTIRVPGTAATYDGATHCASILFSRMKSYSESAVNDTTFYRGGSFKIKVDMTVSKDGHEDTCDPQTSNYLRPDRQVPTASSYLINRDSTLKYTIHYNINDIDHALDDGDEENGIRAFYKNSNTEVIEPSDGVALCEGHEDGKHCITLTEEGLAAGQLYVNSGPREGPITFYVRAVLNDSNASNYTFVPVFTGWSFYKFVSPNIPKYHFNIKGENATYFEVQFENFDVDSRERVVAYKMKFTATGGNKPTESVTIYKTNDDIISVIGDSRNPKIKVAHNEISSLISEDSLHQRVITLELELLTDNGYYGFNTSGEGVGVALQKNDGGGSYIDIDGSTYFTLNDFKYGNENNYMELTPVTTNVTNQYLFTKSKQGIVFDNSPVMMKQVMSNSATCNTNYTCSHWFTISSPQFELLSNAIEAYVGGFQLSPGILTADDTTNILLYLYKEDSSDNYVNVKNGTCGDNFTVECAYVSIPITTFRSIGLININDLTKTRDNYRVIFKYTNERETVPKNFNYGDDYEEGVIPYYDIQTVDDVGLVVNYASYVTDPDHETYDRFLRVKYSLSILRGYSGVRFEVYKGQPKENGGQLVNKLVIPNVTSLEESNDIYINITPEYKGHKGDAGVTADDTLMFDGDFYYIDAIPYYCVDPSDYDCTQKQDLPLTIRNNKTQNERFIANMTISSPVVTVRVNENSQANDARFRITVSDQKSAFGGYSRNNSTNRKNAADAGERYYFKVFTESNGTRTQLTSNSSNGGKYYKTSKYTTLDFSNVNCHSEDTCTIVLEYYVDLDNDGVYEKETFSKTFAVSSSLSYTDTYPQYLGGGLVRFFYQDVINIDKVTYVDYTLYLEMDDPDNPGTTYIEEISSAQDIDLRNNPFHSTGSIYYLDLNMENFDDSGSKTYYIRLDFKDEDGNLGKSHQYQLLILN